jgi:hypothetical protein
MAHTQRRTTFLLVEGVTDVMLWRRFVDASLCELLPCHSKANAVQAIAILDAGPETGAIAIVDADYDRLIGTVPTSPNCILSDGHDVVVDLLCSESFARLLAERGSADKIRMFEERVGCRVLEALLEAAATVGHVRWHSQVDQLSLRFAEIEISKYADVTTLRVDLVKVVTVVIQRTGLSARLTPEVAKACSMLAANGADIRQVVNGHDAVDLLSLGLRSALGSQTAQDAKRETLEIELRLGFDDECLHRTGVFRAVADWEARNPGWRVWRPGIAAAVH